MIARGLRLIAVGVPGLALWHLAGAGHPYGRAVAAVVGAALRLWGWQATAIALETPPGVGLALARPAPGGQEIVRGTVPLTWIHLDTVTAGVVVFAALLAASGMAGARAPRTTARIAAAVAALFAVQCAAVLGVVAGSLPGGATIFQQAGGLLETGATLVAPALAWAWVWSGIRPPRVMADRTAASPRASRAARRRRFAR